MTMVKKKTTANTKSHAASSMATMTGHAGHQQKKFSTTRTMSVNDH
jgi:hypothetical protein